MFCLTPPLDAQTMCIIKLWLITQLIVERSQGNILTCSSLSSRLMRPEYPKVGGDVAVHVDVDVDRIVDVPLIGG